MLRNILEKFEEPKHPLLGPNIKSLKFWGLILPGSFWKRRLYIFLNFIEISIITTDYVDVWFVKNNINLLLNNLKISMLIAISILKVFTFMYWKKYWKSIIEYVTKADIYQRKTKDQDKIEIINKYTKYCRKITYIYTIFTITTSVVLITQPIFKYFSSETYRENVKNGTETYLQVVSSWAPFDNKNNMVGYLVTSGYQSFASIYGAGWVASFDTNAIVIMIFFQVELILLRKDCANIFDDSLGESNESALERIKDCHRRHVELIKYTRLFDSCLSPIMLLYVFVCSVMLCASAYQLNIEKSPLQRFFLMEYLLFGVVQLFMYCWHSTSVLFASQDVRFGPYESTWWKRLKYRKDLYILTAQLNKEVVFSAGPFIVLTLSTFISILKGAYSYYTLIKQSQIQ